MNDWWTQSAATSPGQAMPATGAASILSSCTFCGSLTGKQAAFFIAILLLLLSWHLHLFSILE
jgi:hypothetical protein